jgi:uncharacterized radical SAM protein YgiQ
MTAAEVAERGWDAVDVVFVTGDAYVDHPSFAMAILGRVLEAEGFRVAILSQPDWRSCRAWQTFGRPRVCFAVSAGNMDSMLNHYTAARKVRNDDAYSPGGRIGRRPDRATLAYCQRAREAYPGVPVIAGGVEASLRRLAHYDYWSDKVRRAIILDAKADLVVYGMGERTIVEIVRRLAAGQTVADLRDLRGVVYRLGASETLGGWCGSDSSSWCGSDSSSWCGSCTAAPGEPAQGMAVQLPPQHDPQLPPQRRTQFHCVADGRSETASYDVTLPSYEQVAADKRTFAEMTRLVHRETNPFCARRLVQFHGREAVVVNPPALPLEQAEIDRIYGLPFTRRPHPSYGREPIPAFAVVKDSIQIVRGCFGGCTFCSLTAHQGRVIQSRSQESVLAEIRRVAADPAFGGTISDIGGPTANMYAMHCCRPEVGAKCRRTSCLHPNICRLLKTDHGPLVQLMRAARSVPGVKKALVASGVRMDLARRSPEYIDDLTQHHVGGLLKVAPEHVDPAVLACMHKPPIEEFEQFEKEFCRAAGHRELFLVPYFMAGHPGCDLSAAIRLAEFLKRTGYRPDKVQDFIPAPMDIATCMYHTGIDPMTGEAVYVPKGQRERRMQRALLQFFKPENYRDVRAALEEAGRLDLIGDGPQCLISSRPPKVADTRLERDARGKGKSSGGYRPHRKTAERRDKKGKAPRRHRGHGE